MSGDDPLSKLGDELLAQKDALERVARAVAHLQTAVGRLYDEGHSVVVTRYGWNVTLEVAMRGALPAVVGAQTAPAGTAVVQTVEVAQTPVPAATMTKGPARFEDRWTDEEAAEALRLADGGQNARQVSEAIGRTYRATVQKLAKLRTKRDAKVSPPIVKAEPSPRRIDEGAAVTPVAKEPVEAPRSSGPFIRPAGQTASAAEREIERRLDSLPPGSWTLAMDLALVEGLSQGRKLATVAAELKLGREDALVRWRALCPQPGFEAQAQLSKVLRRLLADEVVEA